MTQLNQIRNTFGLYLQNLDFFSTIARFLIEMSDDQ